MFVRAIEIATRFTRPIHSIARNYGSTLIQPGASTLFFVNADGWAMTCRHVAHQILAAAQLSAKHRAFADEWQAKRGDGNSKQIRRELEKKYGFSKNVVFELHNSFFNCFEGNPEAEIKLHGSMDIALIRFRHFTRLLCTSFPVFAANESDLKQGKFLCRLGFPFAEFSNFAYDGAADRIHWTNVGRTNTPQFPIEGMVTRHVGDNSGRIIGFELSTPGLRGQSGGPAFDTDGRVWGMQAGTAHLDLDFDVDQEVIRAGARKRVIDSAFLHVGHCVHVTALKSFLRENGVYFQEG